MMDIDLKPCPFCGATETTILNGPVEDDWCAVSCDKCYAAGPHNYTDPHAIAAWNRRDTAGVLRLTARIAALEAQVAAADRLADAARVIAGDRKGFNVSWVSLNALRTALATYRAAKGK